MNESMMMAASQQPSYVFSFGHEWQKINVNTWEVEASAPSVSGETAGVAYGLDGMIYHVDGTTSGNLRKIDPSDMSVVSQYTSEFGRLLDVSCGIDGFVYALRSDRIERINPSTMSRSSSSTTSSNLISIFCLPSGDIITGTEGRSIRKWSTSSFSETDSMLLSTSGFVNRRAAFDSQHIYLAAYASGGTVSKVRVSDMSLVAEAPFSTRFVDVALQPGGDVYALTSGRELYRLSSDSLTQMNQIQFSSWPSSSIAYSEAGHLVVATRPVTSAYELVKIDPASLSIVSGGIPFGGDPTWTIPDVFLPHYYS